MDTRPHVREFIRGLSDLPALQRFYNEPRQTKNIQVLTFCRDYDYTHASDYMKERKYSFPVIADWVLIKMRGCRLRLHGPSDVYSMNSNAPLRAD